MELNDDENEATIFGDIPSIRTPETLTSPDDVFTVACHPSAPFFATGLISGCITVYEYRQNATRLVHTLEQYHKRGVNGLEFSDDGRYLYSCSSDRTVRIYDCTSQQNCAKVKRTSENPHQSGISSINLCDPFLFSTGDDDGVVALWDVRTTSKPTMKFEEHADYVSQILYFSEMNTLVSCSGDTCIGSYDLRAGKVSGFSDVRKDELNSMTFLAATNDIVCGTGNGNLPIWKYGSWRRPYDVHEKHPRECECVLAYNDNIFLTTAFDGLVRVVQHHPVKRVLCHLGEVRKRESALTKLGITFDRSLLIGIGNDTKIRFFDIEFLGSEKELDKLRSNFEARHMETIRNSVMEDAREQEGSSKEQHRSEQTAGEEPVLDRTTKRARVAAAKWLKDAKKDRVNFAGEKRKKRRQGFWNDL